jgi:DNA polymerase-3 subunit epsilon
MQHDSRNHDPELAPLLRVKLRKLSVLLIDCQATAHRSAGGALLELAWARLQGVQPESRLNVLDYPVRLPEGVGIPPAVQRLTGIAAVGLANGRHEAAVWGRLKRAARETKTGKAGTPCPCVVHYARFEGPFLRHLHAPDRSPFPLYIICTHEICKRLLPELPRKSLRAVAGFFGYSAYELRRSREHVMATAHIWQRLVRLLENRRIRCLGHLVEWLSRPVNRDRGKNPVYPMPENIRRRLPDSPGVYRLRRINGDLLYIGKAASLKRRVNSHFSRRPARTGGKPEMLTQARDLSFKCTGSALEAALQESDEIKRYSPVYNTALRSGSRRLAYCSRDLRRHSLHPGESISIGPFPSTVTVETAVAFGCWHAARQGRGKCTLPATEIDIGPLLCLPRQGLPDPDCARAGLDAFCRKNRRLIDQPSPLRSLASIGARVWLERLPGKETSGVALTDETGDGGDHPAAGDPTWSPEAVQRALENALSRTALMMRRSRWYRLLGNSCLRWELAGDPAGRRRLLVFLQGRLAHRSCLAAGADFRPPPTASALSDMRRMRFDLLVYDRMRVATTEIKRLVAADRAPVLEFGCRLKIHPTQLRGWLQWV